jgi:very-short-patch-repair endonuclease
MPPIRNIVRGQSVTEEKVNRSKQLRREMTPAETVLWKCLRRNNLEGHHFRRQQVIEGFIADFYCHAAALVVEIDGGVHEQQADGDVERDRVLAHRGFRVLRFTNEEVWSKLIEVLARIVTACRERTDPQAAKNKR